MSFESGNGNLGGTLAIQTYHAFSSVAGLEYSAPFMGEGAVWQLTLSPPDPNAGIWWGTIGPGGTIIWPSPIDPTPPAGGAVLDDPYPAPLAGVGPVINPASTVQALPPGDAAPIT